MSSRYITLDNFFRDAEKIDIEERVQREIDMARDKYEYETNYLIKVYGISREEAEAVMSLEPEGLRRDQDWSMLGYQVIGVEV